MRAASRDGAARSSPAATRRDTATATKMPTRRRPRRRLVAVAGFLLALFAWVNNSALLAGEPGAQPGVLAHRGVAQTFDLAGVEADTCTAERIHPPEHGFLENTIPSMRAAFAAGADLVELDVHITADEQFAVFHDWKVDCRTDGTGTTRDHTMAELKLLDIGHGYTADGGRTFPFRGTGVGMMPSLDEVLAEFPTEPLLIHVKSDDPAEGALLAERLSQLPEQRRAELAVYGGDAPIAELQARLPDLRVMSKRSLTRCLLPYLAVGWTGYVPRACRGAQLHIPEGYARWLWGWPARFGARMAAADTRVVLVAGSGGFSEGFDRPASLRRVPDGFGGLVWTNRVSEIAPLLKDR